MNQPQQSAFQPIGNNGPSTSDSQVQRSYSSATQVHKYPGMDLGVVIEAKEELTIADYAVAMGKLIGNQNLTHISHVSKQRVCIYLKTKEVLEKFLEDHQTVRVKKHVLKVKPYVSTPKRVVISNVNPSIPNDVIVNKLKEVGLNVSATKISNIKAGIKEPGFEHLLSFRRQFFVPPEQIDLVPSSLNITYQNNSFWIYLSAGNPKCFICKAEGHIAKSCQERVLSVPTSEVTLLSKVPLPPSTNSEGSLQQTPTPTTSQLNSNNPFISISTLTNNTTFAAASPPSPVQDISNHVRPEAMEATQQGLKRAHSDISESVKTKDLGEEDASSTDESKFTVVRPRKSVRTSADTNSKQTTQAPAVKELDFAPIMSAFLTRPVPFVLTIEKYKEYLTETLNQSDIMGISLKYTNDIDSLISMIDELGPIHLETNIKSRLKRMRRKLTKAPATPSQRTTSETTEGDVEVNEQDTS